jgi:hypothetical protein
MNLEGQKLIQYPQGLSLTLGNVVGLTRFHGPITVKRSGSTKGVEDGKERQALLS